MADSSSTLSRLLSLLSDGGWHSGEEMGAMLQVSRAAISKQIKHVIDLGIELESQKGVGYRAKAFELLDESRIREAVAMDGGDALSWLRVEHSIPSTNQALLDALQSGQSIHRAACLAEKQTSGRGRRGRQWFSPFAKNVYLSLGWHFRGGVAEIEGLSLAVGVVVCQVLEQMGFAGATLKWPNDILAGNKKLGGVLIELGGDAISDCVVVLGVGLNVAMDAVDDSVDQPWASLSDAGFNGGRNALAIELISALVRLLSSYPNHGFGHYQHEWNHRSAYSGQFVTLSTPSSNNQGLMLGVGEQGQVLIEVDGEQQAFIGGELSLRLQQ